MNLTSRMVCAGCGAAPDPDDAVAQLCPEARAGDGVDHVLVSDLDHEGVTFPFEGDTQPLVRFRELLHGYRLARRSGVGDDEWVSLARELHGRLIAASGVGLEFTPFFKASELGAELGVGSLWVKDETVGIAGSHKARHLAAVAQHLRATAPDEIPRLAVASCGNAALAAGYIARALGWPLEAFVPAEADGAVLERLEHLGVTLSTCERDDEPGDPCYRALLEAVEQGAVPFSCQGSANGLVIEGAATLAWEIVAQDGSEAAPIDNVVVQVGGGALGSAVSQGFCDAHALGAISRRPRLFCVQTAGGHPLERAWRRLESDEALNVEGMARAVGDRARYMTPWDEAPVSLASGLLDDETYDWAALCRGMIATGGAPVVVSEDEITRARDSAREWTSVPVDATGAAGLAGWSRLCAEGVIQPGERSVVLFTGARR